ncbi:UDP-glycosyltransferase 74E2-like [Momordica charantia]|uniref:Mogroside I-E synthase n=1 Tax=Momordica charantia TaxID=3673 RepID=A0A6J1DQW5_MOMCH|nr:UDP-glycosyltransferase 74E2-like [Momordica charantia]
MPWLLPVAKRFGLHGAPFFTQSSAVNQIFDLIHRGALEVPVEDGARISLPSLAVDLDAADLPISFPLGGIAVVKLFKASQFVNLQEVKWMFCNTFHKLEPTVGGEWRMRSIGPSVPSAYLDKRLEDDQSYGISLFSSDTSDDTVEWLNSKAATSVVYVSFGSVVSLEENQVREIASSLRDNNNPFVWVLGESESQKLPTNFLSETSEKGLVLSWCCQLQVLAHSAIGCFVTHCGWNSTLEALSTGVPMVAVPKWSDQTTNAKFISDVWGVGVRAKVNEEGIFTRMEISKCIKELMEGERGKGIRRNSLKWKELAREAMDEGGTSDSNIDDFVKELINST